ncbi:putative 4-alpha-glucanotransferase malQ [Mycobacterium xenopi 4042]|uniref:Putative 4-alpha-glucanotransferase malQ n=1 Tax=Mycobacterium xenopi 4042 TaxID=1299334 RepID=X8BFT5_MYCXE|nr:putative 4-alpha-glucanotransferase malQ [Mycobacterium xenopi 4042]
MPEPAPSLVELAEKFGIATEYEDWAGRHIAIPEETLVAVLGAFGVAAATEQERRAALDADHRAYWARALPPTIVARAGAPTTIWAHVSHGDPAEVWLQLEDGTVRSDLRQVDNFTAPFDLDGCLIGEASFVLPSDLPLGYHRLHLRSGERDADTAVIVTPNRLGIPERLGHSRSWAWPPSCIVCDLKILGHRRSQRSHRPGRVVGGTARRGLPAGQPAACGHADHTDGALAVPAGVAAFRQPALPSSRGDPGIRIPVQARPNLAAASHGPAAGRQIPADRPGQRLGGQTTGAQSALPGAALGGP